MYTEKTFNITDLHGLSQTTIDEHKKLYSGYVKHANLINEKLNAYKGDEAKAYETAELYRRFSFEYNGMRNHECYFALLSEKVAAQETSALAEQITKQWGSLADFTAAFTALALTRGIGWAMLSYDKDTASLIMHWVDEQHLGQLQGTTPIIALDMWEHSYVADYQPSGKKQYINDFLSQVNWSVAEAMYETVR